MPTTAILYPGDMGGAIARCLQSAGHRVITTLAGRSARTRDLGASLEVLPSLVQVMSEADFVVSLVFSSAAVEVATAAAAAMQGLARKPVYIDANAIAPATMRQVDEVIRGAGGNCLDACVLGSAKKPATWQFYLSGPDAQRAADAYSGALPTHVLGRDIGTASGFKVTFSGLLKGMAALCFELGTAAHEQGFLQELLVAYRELPTIEAFLQLAIPTYLQHGARRTTELQELAAHLDQLSLSTNMTRATGWTLEQVAKATTGEAALHSGAPDMQRTLEQIARSGVLRKTPPRG